MPSTEAHHGTRNVNLSDRSWGVLAFALDRDVISVVNVNIVGYILMAVGILGLIMSLVINSQRSRTQHTVVDDRRPIVDDRRLPPDPPVRY